MSKNNKTDEKILEIPKKGGPFVVVEKKYLEELRDALRAVMEGEEALKEGKTRSFKDFSEEEGL